MADDDEARFREPRLAINRVYTKTGDKGTTRLVGGQEVGKDDPRIATYGTVDELNCWVGAARQTIREQHAGDAAFERLAQELLRVQHELFNLGSVLATLPADRGERMPRVGDADVRALEASIDACTGELPALRSFVLPGGTRLNVDLHVCRTVCRRAERLVAALCRPAPGAEPEPDTWPLVYLNRLSDALFVWSRWAAVRAGVPEVLWSPNQSAGAQQLKAE